MSFFSIRLYTDQYYLALGRFVAEFTEIEGAMQVALWRFSKINSPVAQAVFSGVRADEASNKITRIGDAENWTKARASEWKAIADRLAILRTLRNDILHYGAEWEGENAWIITNRDFVHTPKKIMTTPVSVEILAAATSDLEQLSLHLFHFLYADEMTPTGLHEFEQTLRRAWRYTPPPQAGRHGTSRGSAPGQPRQPRPSRASRRKAALERSKKK
jgi:hypothetical protein